jgi:beta-N-acetylhexosaminidase
MLAAIFGLSGERLSEDERAFFRDSNPAGYILFRRNCAMREQLRALTDSLRALHGRADLPILIDQEGGPVARLQPPEWPEFPAAGRFAELYAKAPMSAIQAARLNAQAIAALLAEVGVNVDCAPLLDVAHAGTHPIIADRAFGSDPMQVAALGRAMLEGLAAGGVAGVVKHLPGHGRALADSHKELPVVSASEAELDTDLAPFRTLAAAPMGMMAHVVYTAWDEARPASQSPFVIEQIVRRRIGFTGFLISDDIGMAALTGDHGDRARRAIEAGCDAALHCSGVLAGMAQVAAAVPPLSDASVERLERAMASVAGSTSVPPYEELAEQRDRLLAYA